MNTKKKNPKRKLLVWKLRKRYRWLRLNWAYVQRVLLAEDATGGELHAC